jgi:nitroimidazol reductase NimA-like FMN-containing flavoprotein (pyridoxamine 5'-phosphate oxidase superfamily)
MTDVIAHARAVLAGTSYAVLATADQHGTPWVTPVWFAHHDLDRVYWLSWPGSRHSQLIDGRPEIALTVFDSHAVPNDGAAFSATARARLCPEAHLEEGLESVNRRAADEGIRQFMREHVSGGSRLRLYVADITEAWVLDQDAPVDQRVEVPR